MFPWNDLPSEVQQRLIKSLRPGAQCDLDHRKALRLVSRATKASVDSSIKRLSAPNVVRCNPLQDQPWENPWLQAVLPTNSYFPSVTTLDLSTGDVHTAMLTCRKHLTSTRCFPNLTKFITGGLDGARWPGDVPFAENRPPFRPILKWLHIPRVETWVLRPGGLCAGTLDLSALRAFPNLRKVCIHPWPSVSVFDEELTGLNLLSSVPALCLDDCSGLSRHGLVYLADPSGPLPKSLRTLSLQGVNLEQPIWREELPESLTQLQAFTNLGSLNLGHCLGVDNTAIAILPELRQCLTALSDNTPETI